MELSSPTRYIKIDVRQGNLFLDMIMGEQKPEEPIKVMMEFLLSFHSKKNKTKKIGGDEIGEKLDELINSFVHAQ